MIDPLADAITLMLRQMDDEGVTTFLADGRQWPSGLRQYHQHFRIVAGGKMGCEVAWAARLAELMCSRGIVTQANYPYPGYALQSGKRKQFVDLRIALKSNELLWLEIKGSWPVCFKNDGTGGQSPYIFSRYKSYLLDDTAQDIEKLAALRVPDAHRIGWV